MLKTIRDMFLGAMVAGAVGAAVAAVGIAPGNGFQTVDGTWLNGLAQGVNYAAANGLTAHAGGTQAAAIAVPPNAYMIEFDIVATTGDSTYLPQCLNGGIGFVRNAGLQTLDIYGNATVNPVTGIADTINGTAGSTAYTLATNTSAVFFCAKNGNWSAIHGS